MTGQSPKTWKLYTVKKEDKHNDFDFTAAIEEAMNKAEADGYEPQFVNELQRSPGTHAFIGVFAKKASK